MNNVSWHSCEIFLNANKRTRNVTSTVANRLNPLNMPIYCHCLKVKRA